MQVDVDDRRGSMRGDRDNDGPDPVENGRDLLQRAQDQRHAPRDVDPFRGSDRQDRCGEDESCAVDALVINDDTRFGAKTAR